MAGYVWSPKAGIYCVRYRYYDPLLGRWLQRDPAGYVDGLNLYTYGLGNPWMYTDPYGLFSLGDLASDFVEGLREVGDLFSGRAAREDAAFVEMIRGVERAQKDAICQNYHNGNISAEEARAMWGKVNGMADDVESGLAELRNHEEQMILETAIDIALTVVPTAWIARGVGKALGAIRDARVARILTDAADRAIGVVGPGRGGTYGTLAHSEFARQVNALGSSRMATEVSYRHGQIVPHSTRGSVRADVVHGNPLSPRAVYDLKTGGATLTPERIAQIQRHLPRQNVPIRMIRPR